MLAASLVKQTNIKLSFGAFLWGLKESWPWNLPICKYQKVCTSMATLQMLMSNHSQVYDIYIYMCVCENSSIIKNQTHNHTVSL